MVSVNPNDGGDEASRVSSSPPPPWSKIVTAAELSSSDLVSAVDDCSDKNPASSKPLNGVVVEEEVVSSPVMDEDLWPPLGRGGDSTIKKSESLQEVVTENSSPSSNKPAATVNNAIPNNVAPSVQRSTKRGDGGSSGAFVSSNGIITLRTPARHEALPHTTSGKPVIVAVDSHPKDKESTRGNDHHYQRNSYRRGGNGVYHHNYGGKPDQGRGNQEWNQHRNFNNNMQPQRGGGGGFRRGGYIRPSVHNSPPIIPPMHMPMRPFVNNLIYPPDAMIYFQGPAQPMVPAPLYFPFPDPVLHGKILTQINYYFSNENLVKDTFLRRNMDEQGWVSVNLIAGFNKVSSMTDDVQLILHVMRASNLVEVQGDKLRRRNDWMRWLLPAVGQDSLASQLQGIGLSSSSSRSSSSGELHQGGGRERPAVV